MLLAPKTPFFNISKNEGIGKCKVDDANKEYCK